MILHKNQQQKWEKRRTRRSALAHGNFTFPHIQRVIGKYIVSDLDEEIFAKIDSISSMILWLLAELFVKHMQDPFILLSLHLRLL